MLSFNNIEYRSQISKELCTIKINVEPVASLNINEMNRYEYNNFNNLRRVFTNIIAPILQQEEPSQYEPLNWGESVQAQQSIDEYFRTHTSHTGIDVDIYFKMQPHHLTSLFNAACFNKVQPVKNITKLSIKKLEKRIFWYLFSSSEIHTHAYKISELYNDFQINRNKLNMILADRENCDALMLRKLNIIKEEYVFAAKHFNHKANGMEIKLRTIDYYLFEALNEKAKRIRSAIDKGTKNNLPIVITQIILSFVPLIE